MGKHYSISWSKQDEVRDRLSLILAYGALEEQGCKPWEIEHKATSNLLKIKFRAQSKEHAKEATELVALVCNMKMKAKAA